MDDQDRQADSAERARAGPALCIWRVHDDGTRTLLATPVDAGYAGRLADQLRARGMHIEVVEQPAPYGHTDNQRLWDQPLPHPQLEDQIARDIGSGFSRRAATALRMEWLPTDELLRILRGHAEAGAADDDMLALLQEVLRLRAREEACRRHSADLAAALGKVAACLYRTDAPLCVRALEDAGFGLHDLFGDDRSGAIDEDWIDELVAEVQDD